MLHGELTARGNLRGELTGGVFYGTMDYDELINKPSINSVVLVGNKTLEDLGIIIPTATSELTNDSGFITAASVPTKTSELINDNDFVSSSDLSAVAYSGDYDDLLNKPTIPTNTSDLNNDSGFITSADIPTNLSDFNNDEGFIGFTDLTDTLIAGNTSITISDAAIETTSTIDIYVSTFGIQPTNAVVATGTITLTFLAQASDITVKVRVS